jgi:hypothetical protein
MTKENKWFPLCFESYKVYSSWMYQRNAAQEVATVCDDCESWYMEKMLNQGRCNSAEAKKNSTNSTKR